MKAILTKQLTLHEGVVLKVYKCPAGYLTIGVGRNLEGKGLTKEECLRLNIVYGTKAKVIEQLQVRGINLLEAEYLLSNDIDFFTKELTTKLSWFTEVPEKVKIVLVDMAFNLGTEGLLKFKRTLESIRTTQYKKASVEMLESKWAKQVGKRAISLSNILKSV